LDYLDWLRWPDGFACPSCGACEGWRLGDGRWKCAACAKRVAVTAGTLFDRRRTPLTVWFQACWEFAVAKDGIPALTLQRNLEIGSYATAWAMLHRLRSVLVRPGRERLVGSVEVDETYIGGVEPGLKGGREKGKKTLVVVAVEVGEERGLGRCRMRIIPDATGLTLQQFVTDTVEPGTHVITDGWAGYKGLPKRGYVHEPRSQRAAKAHGEDAGALLPGVHRVASLAKRWLLGTHQGAVSDEHLAEYLDEFVFRFNRRRSASRGLLFYRLLQLAVAHEPVRYTDLVAKPAPKSTPPRPPHTPGHPPSLDRAAADRPWRNAPPIGPVN
jgi:transposase-like protein